MADQAIKRRKTEETSQQSEDAEPQSDWFTQRRLPDDVTLKFDDGKELFASKGLLMCASQVFEAMFTHDMKEKETNVVEMPGRIYDHFLELLKCLHPGIAKPVTHKNVFYLVELSHLYEMNGLLQRCHYALRKVILHEGTLSESDFQLSIHTTYEVKEWLKRNNKEDCNVDNTAKTANRTLKVLSTAGNFPDVFESLIAEAIDILSHISVKCYHGTRNSFNCFNKYETETILKQNKEMFDQLDSVLRASISRARQCILE